MSMTKSEIINSIYENLGISKKDCIRIVESVF
jgi:nucleoid DNA-binding protein